MQWWQRGWARLRAWLGLRRQPDVTLPDLEKEDLMTPATSLRRPWTLMVYMAGDNGKLFDTKYGKLRLMAEMTTAGYQDLLEMGAVGTTANVAVICLFDTQDGTYLVEVRKGQGFADSLPRQLREVNTGDPNTLAAFIEQSVKAYPADRYALVIWNHGTGWLDVDAYAVVRGIGDEGQSHVPIFRTTPQKMTGGDTTRPIAYDDSSKDFLDTRDLRRALGQAKAATGVRFDLIGMDACLMAMVEGARELVHFTDYFVASQEVEPMTGWPYRPILAGLDSRPDMPAADLANLIVEEFARSYGGATRGETVTQSAIALPRTGQTEALCKALAEAILADGSASLKRLVARAEDKALVFQDRNYRDLGDFAAKLAEETEWEDFPAVTAAAAALRDHLQARSAEAPVLRVGFLPDYQRATGLSVYLPPSQRAYVPEPYRRLLFAQATGWDRLLDWLFGE